MNKDKIAENVVAHLLPDYGISDALMAIVKPHIKAIKAMVEKGDVVGLEKYEFKKEGILGDFLNADMISENQFLWNMGYVISFGRYYIRKWSDAGYNAVQHVIILRYDMDIPIQVANSHPEWKDQFVRDLYRAEMTIRHEVTHAVRDSQTHHIEKFVDKMKSDQKVVKEYNERGHKDLEFEIDAVVNSLEVLKRKMGKGYDKLDEDGLENKLSGLKFPRIGDPARHKWIQRLMREDLLPEKMIDKGRKGMNRIEKIAESMVAAKFDTKKEIQKYKQEHHPESGTKLQVRNKQEMKQRNKDKKGQIAALAMVLATKRVGDMEVEMLLDITNGFVQIGMGGEWWNGQLRVGKTILHHKKEHVDPAYLPVEVVMASRGYEVHMEVTGGFYSDTTFSFIISAK